MRRKQKRLLQLAGLLIVALLFLPNVGLWSLYRDRMFDNSPDSAEALGGFPPIQVGTRPLHATPETRPRAHRQRGNSGGFCRSL